MCKNTVNDCSQQLPDNCKGAHPPAPTCTHHPHLHPPLFFSCKAAWMEKRPARWDSNLRPHCPRPAATAAAADSCTGAARIDHSNIPLQLLLLQAKVCYFFSEGRWIRDLGEGHRRGCVHEEEAHAGGQREQQKVSCRWLDGAALIHFGEILLFFCSLRTFRLSLRQSHKSLVLWPSDFQNPGEWKVKLTCKMFFQLVWLPTLISDFTLFPTWHMNTQQTLFFCSLSLIFVPSSRRQVLAPHD